MYLIGLKASGQTEAKHMINLIQTQVEHMNAAPLMSRWHVIILQWQILHC